MDYYELINTENKNFHEYFLHQSFYEYQKAYYCDTNLTQIVESSNNFSDFGKLVLFKNMIYASVTQY